MNSLLARAILRAQHGQGGAGTRRRLASSGLSYTQFAPSVTEADPSLPTGPTHTDQASPVATGGSSQPQPISRAERALRRPLLEALALERARNLAPGGKLGVGTQHRLAQVNGLEAPQVQALTPQAYQFLLSALTKGGTGLGMQRRRPRGAGVSRYGGLF